MVWITLSLAFLMILAAPFLLGRERLAALVPACERKARFGTECALCGMTTSFLEISQGKFGAARRANRAGIPLYLTFVSNEILALVWVRRKRSGTCKQSA